MSRVTEYADAINAGEMTVEEAVQKAIEQERDERERIGHDASARQLWHKGLEQMVVWVAEWIGGCDDEHLAWYTAAGAMGSEHVMTAERIDGAIAQLNRVRLINFGGSNGHVETRGSKNRTKSA